MDEKLRINLMKITALTAMFCFAYPGIVMLRSSVLNSDSGIVDFIYAISVAMAGFLFGKIIIREKSMMLGKVLSIPFIEFILGNCATVSFLSRFIAYIAVMIPVVVVIVIHAGEGLLALALECFIAVFLYVAGLRVNFKEFESILGSTGLHIGLVFSTFFVFLSTYISGFHHFRFQIALCVFIAVICSLIVQNQANLDSMIMKKEAHSANIPKNIRGFNIKIVIVFIIITILLLNLNSVVVFLLETIRHIGSYLLNAIFKILSSLSPDTITDNTVKTQNLQIPFFGRNSIEHPIKNFIFNVFRNFLLLYILYKLIPLLLRKIVQLIIRMADLIRRILSKRVINIGISLDDDFVDETEILKPVLRRSDKGMKSTFKKTRRSLNNITDPVQRVRFIYACIIEMLIEARLDIEDSDTTGQILQKSSKMTGICSYLQRNTQIYDKVRYGDTIPDNREVLEMDNNYSRIFENVGQQDKTNMKK